MVGRSRAGRTTLLGHCQRSSGPRAASPGRSAWMQWPTGALSEAEKLVVSPAMLEVTAERASRLCPGACALIAASADALPFRDGTFDVAYPFSVIDLLEAPRGPPRG